MKGPVVVSPSILSADFLNLANEIESVEKAGCDWLHVDVMDGHFVPNLTIGPPHVDAISDRSKTFLDVHLMIDNPELQIDWYTGAGADMCTFHIETLPEDAAKELISYIHSQGVRAGVAICPPTDISLVEPFVALADMILVMSVNPGFSGQSFISNSPQRVASVCQMAQSQGANPLIEVDGGINAQTAPLVVEQGADVLVAGNAIFKADDRASVISLFHSLRS